VNDPVGVSTEKYNPGPDPDQPSHGWPADGEHLWGEWRLKTGLPKPTKYRQCVHPKCDAVEVTEATQA
jgi:hypothetical protein